MSLEQKLFEIPTDANEALENEESQILTETESQAAVQERVGVFTREEMLEFRIRKIKILEAQLAALEAKYKPIIEEMQTDIRFVERKLDWHKRAINQILTPSENSEFIGEVGSVFYAPVKKVEIVDDSAIPVDFCRVVTEPDLRAVKAALEQGAEVPGARMAVNYSLRIGAGGERGRANSRQRAKKKESTKQE